METIIRHRLFLDVLLKIFFFINFKAEKNEASTTKNAREETLPEEIELREKEYLDLYRQTTRWQTL